MGAIWCPVTEKAGESFLRGEAASCDMRCEHSSPWYLIYATVAALSVRTNSACPEATVKTSAGQTALSAIPGNWYDTAVKVLSRSPKLHARCTQHTNLFWSHLF